MRFRDFWDFTTVLLNNFYYLPALSPFIFIILQFISPSYLLRNVLISLSAPGAVAGVCLYAIFIIRDVLESHASSDAYLTSAWMLVTTLIALSGYFPACWIMPISLIVAIKQKRNGWLANTLFALSSLFILMLYFFTRVVARA
jgi:hypothetical protein